MTVTLQRYTEKGNDWVPFINCKRISNIIFLIEICIEKTPVGFTRYNSETFQREIRILLHVEA